MLLLKGFKAVGLVFRLGEYSVGFPRTDSKYDVGLDLEYSG